jgi:hypothetical protein
MSLCGVAVGAFALAAPNASAVAGTSASPKPGNYVGTTSQGEPFKFKIQKTSCYSAAHSEGGGLGHPKAGYCYVPVTFGTLDNNYPTLNETCSDGSMIAISAYASGFELLLSHGGVEYTRQGFDTVDPDAAASTSTFKIKVTHSTATGTINQTDSSENNGSAITCSSGAVTFKAHRT